MQGIRTGSSRRSALRLVRARPEVLDSMSESMGGDLGRGSASFLAEGLYSGMDMDHEQLPIARRRWLGLEMDQLHDGLRWATSFLAAS